eukprot:EG_transcript_36149
MQFDPETVQRGVERFRLKAEQRIFQNEREKHAARRTADRATPFDILAETPAIGPAQPALPHGVVLRKKRKRPEAEPPPPAGRETKPAQPRPGRGPPTVSPRPLMHGPPPPDPHPTPATDATEPTPDPSPAAEPTDASHSTL